MIDAADGRKRCFWSNGALGGYHDTVHGRQPTTDQEFFQRLSLEILDGERALVDAGRWAPLLADFDIVRLAESGANCAVPRSMEKRARMVIENARRWVRLAEPVSSLGESAAISGRGPQRNPVLARLAIGRAAPQQVARTLRRVFVVPRNFAMWTFLQSVGVAPGAHHPGCTFGQESDSAAVAGAYAADHTIPKPPLSV
ncbi:MAG: hypothetical protein ACT4P6_09925 [Gemmatimonadaceae bacterium]